VDDVLTVGDAELVETMAFFASRMKMVVEPTGCLGAAAVFGRQLDLRGKRVGIVLSGGNVDLLRFASLIQAAPQGADDRRTIDHAKRASDH
jgi:threonine dehydratase